MIAELVCVVSVTLFLLASAFYAFKITLQRCDPCLVALKRGEWISTLDLSERAGIPTHAIYHALEALEDDGLVTSELLSGGPERGWRPRRFYRITDEGLMALEEQKEDRP